MCAYVAVEGLSLTCLSSPICALFCGIDVREVMILGVLYDRVRDNLLLGLNA